MKKELLFSLNILCFFSGALAQDAAFMNAHHSLVQLNPSFAGSNGYLRHQTSYRNQWPNLSGTMVTYQTCFDGYIKPIKGGFAISGFSDDMARGTLRHTQVSAAYAQYISINEQFKIVPSLQASYALYGLDKGRLNFGDVFHPRFGLAWNTGWIPGPNWWSGTTTGTLTSRLQYTDVSAGLLMNYKENYFGVSCSHLTEPNISLLSDRPYRLPIKTIIHSSHQIAISGRTNGNMLLIFTNQGPYQSAGGRLLNCFDQRILYGLGYSNFWTHGYHQAAFYAGFTKKAFTVSYCYDICFSKLRSTSAGSHELSISLSFKRKSEQWTDRSLEAK